MSVKNKCIFNDSWLSDSRFSQWLNRSVNSTKAYCNFCQKYFDIYNMGVAGLTSYAADKKHWQEILGLRQPNVGASFFQKQSSEQKQGSSSNSKSKTVESMLIPASPLKAEVF